MYSFDNWDLAYISTENIPRYVILMFYPYANNYCVLLYHKYLVYSITTDNVLVKTKFI